jgi:hypothetical protein
VFVGVGVFVAVAVGVLVAVGVAVGVTTHGATLLVALYDPVKLDPPPPRAPPVTNAVKLSGVPA